MAETKKKNSRDKGGRGERQAAKEFRDWWGTDFARTPASGGFGTARFRNEWNAAGDLVTPDPTFPFCVECKWVEGWSLEQVLTNDGCLIFRWWQQAQGECPPDKLPLLVFKRNNRPFYCMIEANDFASQEFLRDSGIRYYQVPLLKNVTGTVPMMVYIFALSDFFKLDPEIWQNQKKTLVTNRQLRLQYPKT